MQRDLDEAFPFVTLSEFASWTHFANWLDISASKVKGRYFSCGTLTPVEQLCDSQTPIDRQRVLAIKDRLYQSLPACTRRSL